MKTDGSILVLFDGVCNLCNGAVQFIIKRDPAARFKFASLQSDIARQYLRRFGSDPDALPTIIVIEDDTMYERSDAALKIAKHLNGVWPALSVFKILPRFIRDGVYDIVANNRYKLFGKRDRCMIPSPELKERFLG